MTPWAFARERAGQAQGAGALQELVPTVALGVARPEHGDETA